MLGLVDGSRVVCVGICIGLWGASLPGPAQAMFEDSARPAKADGEMLFRALTPVAEHVLQAGLFCPLERIWFLPGEAGTVRTTPNLFGMGPSVKIKDDLAALFLKGLPNGMPEGVKVELLMPGARKRDAAIKRPVLRSGIHLDGADGQPAHSDWRLLHLKPDGKLHFRRLTPRSSDPRVAKFPTRTNGGT